MRRSLRAKRDETAIETQPLPHLRTLSLIHWRIANTNDDMVGPAYTVSFN
jgi:hypothetical protein